MSTQEIRDSFVSRLSYQDQIFEYAQRSVFSLQQAGDDRRLLYMWAAPVVPLQTEVDVKSQELRVLFQDGLLNNLPFPPDLYCGQPRPCLDGIEAELSESERIQFIRLRRNGFLEFGTDRTLATRIDQVDCIHAFAVSAILENFSAVASQVLEKLEVQGPVALGCSLINVRGLKLFIGNRYLEPISRTDWERAILDLGHQVTYDFAAEKTFILRGISDRLWNAFHYDECVFYQSGELIPPG